MGAWLCSCGRRMRPRRSRGSGPSRALRAQLAGAGTVSGRDVKHVGWLTEQVPAAPLSPAWWPRPPGPPFPSQLPGAGTRNLLAVLTEKELLLYGSLQHG